MPLDDDLTFTERELAVLDVYRNPDKAGIGRAVRVSIQYAIGTGLLVVACIVTNNAWLSLTVYAALLFWMLVRILKARRIADVMPSVIQKYEARIAALEAQSRDV